MSRLMSVAMTTDAVIERRKTVTRRKGWTFLKPGDTLTLCRKVQGRKPGEPLDRIAEVEVVSVDREPLDLLLAGTGYGRTEVEREGFPGMSPDEFVGRFFTEAQGLYPADEVTRIEWRYLDDQPATDPHQWPPITADTLRAALTATHHADDKTALDRGLAGCGVEDCGDIRCDRCTERMTCTGPEPRACGVTCADCPCDCPPCAQRAQDRAADLAYDVAREAGA